MKNNKALIVAGIILLNILVVFMISQSLLGKQSRYDVLLSQARSLAAQELCSKSVEKYNEAITIKDTLNVRLEIVDVYIRGIDIGEFAESYDIFTAVTGMVDQYPEKIAAYESACAMLLRYERYEDCAKVLMKARDFRVTSDLIEAYRGQVRYLYTQYFGTYTELLPLFNGMYTVGDGVFYSFLNPEGNVELEGSYLYASSFSEGYAFVKSGHPDGNDRSILIDKTGERQIYLKDVEECSGVGKAKNAEGEAVYLLACKVKDRYAYYDVNGNEVFGDYAFAGRFRNNVAAVMEEEGKWRLIDGTGKPITELVFSDVVLNEFDECAPKGLIFAKHGNAYHLYNMKAEQIGDFACDGAKGFVDDGYAAFQRDGLWGFVDAGGKIAIAPQYEDAKSFSCYMGAVKIDGSWTFINPENEVVTEDRFEDVDYLNEKGVCFVKEDGYWSYIKMYYTGK